MSPRGDRPPPSPPRDAIDYDRLAADDDFRFGVDLFNHGFPWEAHEAWEPLWFAAPRDRPERALLQGLIHAAAAAVKARSAALAVARDFATSACDYLADATAQSVVDARALATAFHAWGHDPAQPVPRIDLVLRSD
jgi:hypothetical protein